MDRSRIEAAEVLPAEEIDRLWTITVEDESLLYPHVMHGLLLSHERMRVEIASAERLLDSGATKIARLEATIRQQQQEIMDLRTEIERSRVC